MTLHQKREVIARREHGDETLAEIGRSYNVSGWTGYRRIDDRAQSTETSRIEGKRKIYCASAGKMASRILKKYGAVKLLARSVIEAIAASTGWNKDYTYGVLAAWESRMSYCDAVLRDTIRIDIDGNATDEVVDDT